MIFQIEVVDVEFQPIENVNVVLIVNGERTLVGTATNKQGIAELESDAITNESIIEISAIGFKTIAGKVSNLNYKAVQLEDDVIKLNEYTGYYKKKTCIPCILMLTAAIVYAAKKLN